MRQIKFSIIGYERLVEAMIFGQHYIITENGKWKKTNKTRKEFFKDETKI